MLLTMNHVENNTLDSFRLVGLRLGKKTTNENGQSAADCGYLWKKFEEEGIFNLIPGKKRNEILAVYFDYDGDETKPFSYFIGCEVDQEMPTPEGLSELVIPAQHYRKVLAKGAMTGCITDAWKKIWSSGIDRQFGFDFEVYGAKSSDWSNAEVDIYVSVNRGSE